jgi:hypothetical protein
MTLWPTDLLACSHLPGAAITQSTGAARITGPDLIAALAILSVGACRSASMCATKRRILIKNGKRGEPLAQ